VVTDLTDAEVCVQTVDTTVEVTVIGNEGTCGPLSAPADAEATAKLECKPNPATKIGIKVHCETVGM
jgi:hypothetical protein